MNIDVNKSESKIILKITESKIFLVLGSKNKNFYANLLNNLLNYSLNDNQINIKDDFVILIEFTSLKMKNVFYSIYHFLNFCRFDFIDIFVIILGRQINSSLILLLVQDYIINTKTSVYFEKNCKTDNYGLLFQHLYGSNKALFVDFRKLDCENKNTRSWNYLKTDFRLNSKIDFPYLIFEIKEKELNTILITNSNESIELNPSSSNCFFVDSDFQYLFNETSKFTLFDIDEIVSTCNLDLSFEHIYGLEYGDFMLDPEMICSTLGLLMKTDRIEYYTRCESQENKSNTKSKSNLNQKFNDMYSIHYFDKYKYIESNFEGNEKPKAKIQKVSIGPRREIDSDERNYKFIDLDYTNENKEKLKTLKLTENDIYISLFKGMMYNIISELYLNAKIFCCNTIVITIENEKITNFLLYIKALIDDLSQNKIRIVYIPSFEILKLLTYLIDT